MKADVERPWSIAALPADRPLATIACTDPPIAVDEEVIAKPVVVSGLPPALYTAK